MGKKRRLNRLISKWIKSDLPEDRCSTVLLLGVTRIPTSPTPTRRINHHQPRVLPLTPLRERRAAPQVRRGSITSTGGGAPVRRNSLRKKSCSGLGRHCQVPALEITSPPAPPSDKTSLSTTTLCSESKSGRRADGVTSSPSSSSPHDVAVAAPPSVMERSVDSIGTCSLDVETSICDASDWSEASSVGTLRSASILTVSPAEPHLPSYLSLACTINGYSTTTNYDPIRLARSRDASPHRIEGADLTSSKPTYSVHNNLLSPPNLVPLPTADKEMGENALAHLHRHHHHPEFYSSTKTMSFMSKETRFTSNIFTSKDAIDACLDGTIHSSKCVSFESKNITSVNGESKCTSETSIRKEYTNGSEAKSFIQQRVERLYGPGALAQGFFVSKRQKNRLSESEDKNASTESEKHSKSMTDKLIEEDLEPSMKQSTSSPTLPVLRHLRPEFRAQLPIFSPRKGAAEMQKSVTVPKLKEDVKVNGHSGGEEDRKLKGHGHGAEVTAKEKIGEKDGHYFLKILEEQAERLLKLAARIEGEISTPDLSEEVIGKLRSASGKARLLVSQKMQQFKGLCTNNINQSVGEAFPTTNEDLQGFWDMVMLQVHQVDALFAEIDSLRRNNWVEIDKVEKVNTNGTAKLKKSVARPRPTSAVNEEARKQREAQRRKIIEERRKAMKAQQSQPRESIEIFVPESS